MRSKFIILAYLLSGAAFVVLGLTYFKVQKINELSREINQLDTEIQQDLDAIKDSLLEMVPSERMDSLSSLLPIRDKGLTEFTGSGWEDAYSDVQLEFNNGKAFFLYDPEIFKDKTQAKKFAIFFSRSLTGTNDESLKINQLSELKTQLQLRRQVPRQYNYVYVATPANRDSIQFLLKYLPDNWGLVDKVPGLFTDSEYTGRDTAYTRLFLQSFGKIVVPKERREEALVRNIMIDDVGGLHY